MIGGIGALALVRHGMGLGDVSYDSGYSYYDDGSTDSGYSDPGISETNNVPIGGTPYTYNTATQSVSLPTASGSIPITSPTNSSSSFNWDSVLGNSINTAAATISKGILQSTLPAGTLQETLANGSQITYRQPTGSSAISIPGISSSVSSFLPIILIGGIILLVVSKKS